MTEQKKYLLGFILGVAVLGTIWVGVMEGTKKGEPTPSAPLSASPGPSQDSASSPRNEDSGASNIDIETTRPVVESFLQAFLSFQGDHPEKHIEAAEPYVMPQLYEEWKQQPPRPTADINSQRLVRITGAHGISTGSGIEWSVGAVVEVADRKGSKRLEEWTYVVSLVNDNGWKVAEVSQRGAFD